MDFSVDSIRDIMGLLKLKDYGLDSRKLVSFFADAYRHATRLAEPELIEALSALRTYIPVEHDPQVVISREDAMTTIVGIANADLDLFSVLRETSLDEDQWQLARFNETFPEWHAIPISAHLETVTDAIAELLPGWAVPSEPTGENPLEEEDELEEGEEMGYGNWAVSMTSPDKRTTLEGWADYPVGAMLDLLEEARRYVG